MAERENKVTIYPLGGLGEIGLNCMLLEAKDSAVLIDCGLMFPDDFHYGIDVVIPRLDFIIEKKDKLKGIVLTHGHEDHIGALPWLMPHIDTPLIGSRFTLTLINNKLKEHNLAEQVTMQEVSPRESVTLGDFNFHFFPVCHSIINGYGLGIETPVGRMIHTGDFKIDRRPLGGHHTDLAAFAEFSQPGVKLLLSDSTNVEREGFALTEREIKSTLQNIFAQAQGRILLTLFSSHIQRIQEIFDLAKQSGRQVAVSGKSLTTNIEVSRELGFLQIPDDHFCSLDDLPYLPDDQVVLLVTGSQGEPMSALTRLADGAHKQLRIHKGDTVIMSSRFIPGNTRAINKVINKLYKLGADVLYEKVQAIHASGHAHREDLSIMLKTVQPKFFIPIHGEYRHLFKHTLLAQDYGVPPERTIILEDGQPLTFTEDGLRFEEEVFAQSVLVDGKGVGDVGRTILKERQLLGDEGMVIFVLILDNETGEVIMGPQLLSKGFVFEQQYAHVLEEAKQVVLEVYEKLPPGSWKKIREKCKAALRKYFRKILDRDPVIIPLVINI